MLKRSAKFRAEAGKNKNKELVIIKDGKAISNHCPCSLIMDECLIVKYIKAGDKRSVLPKRRGLTGELVLFHVLVKGGKSISKIMRNSALKDSVQEISVYAYKGEKVRDALKRDGRLLDDVFKKTCVLSHIRNEEITEMSCLVDNLHGETVKIIRVNKSSQPPSQPSSLDEDYMTSNEAKLSEFDGNQVPSQPSASTESGKDSVPKSKQKQNDDMAPEIHYNVMQDSHQLQVLLSTQIKCLVKGMKTEKVSKPPRIQNLFREEYGQNAERCMEIKTVKKLMELSFSVCHVRIQEKPGGTGFLLFDKFVLTNAHVITDALNGEGRLSKEVTVHFSDENFDEMSPGAQVEEITGFEHGVDKFGHYYDWALLKLTDIPGSAVCLLTKFGFLPQGGGICIIGHPAGGVKKIDPCVIVPDKSRDQVVKSHSQENPKGVYMDPSDYGGRGNIQFVSPRFFDNVAESVQKPRQVLTYESCFYFGSSGSPVFDKYCNVVAMHSGGYTYKNEKGEQCSVIEFGYPLLDIIQRIIVQLVERKRFDVLKEYLSCDNAQHNNLMLGLRNLVDERNISAFKDALNNQEVTNDDRLKPFFEFLSTVPMDID